MDSKRENKRTSLKAISFFIVLLFFLHQSIFFSGIAFAHEDGTVHEELALPEAPVNSTTQNTTEATLSVTPVPPEPTAAFLQGGVLQASSDETSSQPVEAAPVKAPSNSKDAKLPVISAVTSTSVTSTSATINWATNEPATSQVEYSTNSTYVPCASSNCTALDSSLVTSHSQNLTNLSSDASYYYWVLSQDAAGNLKVSSPFSFRTLTAPDTVPPTISNVLTSNLTYNSATINWTTNELSDSQIEYGTTTAYGTLSTLTDSTTKVTNHTQTLSSLIGSTTYHYRVRSRDAAGNLAFSLDFTFITNQTPPNTAPVVTLSTPTNVATNEGQLITIIVYGTDAENNPLTYTDSPAPAGSTFVTATDKKSATFKWTPTYTQHGVYNVTFKVFDGIDTTSVIVTINVADVNAAPVGGAINVDQVDADFNLAGYQVYEGSYWSTVTYSSPIKDPDATTENWSWSYRMKLNGDLNWGSEILVGQGTSLSIPSTAFNYQGKAAGLYEWILRVNDGVNFVEKRQTTEVLSGTWASVNTPSIFLDFDGTYLSSWGSYSNITTPRFSQDTDTTSFNDSELTTMGQVFLATIEKFSIFGLTVVAHDLFVPTKVYATKDDEFRDRDAYYTANKILQVSIGGNSSWYGAAVGGLSYVNSFTSSIPNTAFVFSSNLSNAAKYIWEAVAHEAGHAFGLQHQSLYDSTGVKTAEYNPGSGGVAPIMGNSYDKRGLWWYGTSTSKNTYQDDMAVIASSTNGFGFKGDDHGNDINSASAFDSISGTSVTGKGVIGGHTNTTAPDVDYFKFTTTTAGTVSFTVSGAQYGGMLDVKLELYDANGVLVASRDVNTKTFASTSETLSLTLNAGTYYLAVKGRNTYYGDVGQYWINGTVPVGTTTSAGPNAIAGAASTTFTTSSTSSSPSGGLAASGSLAEPMLPTREIESPRARQNLIQESLSGNSPAHSVRYWLKDVPFAESSFEKSDSSDDPRTRFGRTRNKKSRALFL